MLVRSSLFLVSPPLMVVGSSQSVTIPALMRLKPLVREEGRLLPEQEPLLHEQKPVLPEKERLLPEKERLLPEQERLLPEQERLLPEKEPRFRLGIRPRAVLISPEARASETHLTLGGTSPRPSAEGFVS
jgi:hypothetical protein